MNAQRPRNISLIAAGLLLLASHTAGAELQFGPSCMIQSTPFYQRLLAAGVFGIAPERVAAPRPVQLLFRVARGLRYSADRSKTDNWQTAEETTNNYGGDCEDKAIWLYTKMRQNGYRDVSLHIGKYAPSSKKFHMWVTYVDENGRTLLLDPTIQIRPWEVEKFPPQNYQSRHILTGDDCISL